MSCKGSDHDRGTIEGKHRGVHLKAEAILSLLLLLYLSVLVLVPL